MWLAKHANEVLALGGLADIATSRLFDTIRRPLTIYSLTPAHGRPYWRMNISVVKEGRTYIFTRDEEHVMALIGHCLEGD